MEEMEEWRSSAITKFILWTLPCRFHPFVASLQCVLKMYNRLPFLELSTVVRMFNNMVAKGTKILPNRILYTLPWYHLLDNIHINWGKRSPIKLIKSTKPLKSYNQEKLIIIIDEFLGICTVSFNQNMDRICLHYRVNYRRIIPLVNSWIGSWS